MRKYGKKVLAYSLAVAMMMSVTPVSAATKKPTLSAGAKVISVGDTTTLTVKNKPAKATYSFVSSNKNILTVNAKGVVTAKKVGTATVTCNVKNGKTTTKVTTKINVIQSKNAGTKTITAGETATLKVNQYKDAKYYWKSTNTAVASVNSKGVVTAKKAGTATIRVRVTSAKQNYIAKYTVKVNTEKKVVTQAQLDSALKNKKITSLTIATKKDVNLTIPEGNYKNIALTVNTPNADITNNGVFKSVRIIDIKPSTWHEKATGNCITVRATNASIVVEEGASVEAMSFTVKGANAKVVVNGTVKQIKVTKENTLNLEANGKVENVAVNAPSKVAVTGKTKEGIKLEMSKKAEGAKLTSSVKVSVSTPVKVDISLEKGAEGSDVKVTEKDVNVSLDNKTDEKVTITTTEGTKDVATGETSTNNSTTTGESSNSGGSSSSGGSSNSGENNNNDNSSGIEDTYAIYPVYEGTRVKVTESVDLLFSLEKNKKRVQGTDLENAINNKEVEVTVNNENVKIGTLQCDKDKKHILVPVKGKVVSSDSVVTVKYHKQTATTQVIVSEKYTLVAKGNLTVNVTKDNSSTVAVELKDSNDKPVSGAAVTWSSTDKNGTYAKIDGNESKTNVNGIAEIKIVGNELTTNAVKVTAECYGETATFDIIVQDAQHNDNNNITNPENTVVTVVSGSAWTSEIEKAVSGAAVDVVSDSGMEMSKFIASGKNVSAKVSGEAIYVENAFEVGSKGTYAPLVLEVTGVDTIEGAQKVEGTDCFVFIVQDQEQLKITEGLSYTIKFENK